MTDEWRSYTAGHQIISIADDGNLLWVGTTGGLAKIDKMSRGVYFYNDLNSPLNLWPGQRMPILINSHRVWVVSKGKLICYDGITWTVFDSTNSPLQSKYITAVDIDSSNIVWIGTWDQGLYKFDGSDWTSYSTLNSNIPVDDIRVIKIGRYNDLWIGTDSHGLMRYNNSSWNVYNTANSRIVSNCVTQIGIDSKNCVWVGTDQGLCSFNGSMWNVFTPTITKLSTRWVTSMAIDRTDKIWIGCRTNPGGVVPSSGTGLFSYDGIQWISYTTTNSSLPDNSINAISSDRDNQLWVGTEEGMVEFADNRWSAYRTYETDLHYPDITAIAEDCTRNIWVGSFNNDWTMRAKIVKYDGQDWTVFNQDIFGGERRVPMHFVTDYNNILYAGILSYDLSAYDGSNWKRYPAYSPSAITVDKNNILWMGINYGAVAKLQDGIFTELYDHPAFESIDYACVDSNNIKWFAGSNGVMSYNDDVFRAYIAANSDVPDTRFNAIAVDNNNVLWAGGWKFLVRFDGGQWKTFNLQDLKLSSDEITALAVDKGNIKWFGTTSGEIVQFDDITFSKKSPFTDDRNIGWINRIMVDRNNNKWFATKQGIYVYRKGGIIPTKIEKNTKSYNIASLALLQNFPNPFNLNTVLKFSLQNSEQVTLKVFSILGQEVAELVNEKLSEGIHSVNCNASELPNGVYFIVLQAGNYRQVRKAILLK